MRTVAMAAYIYLNPVASRFTKDSLLDCAVGQVKAAEALRLQPEATIGKWDRWANFDILPDYFSRLRGKNP